VDKFNIGFTKTIHTITRTHGGLVRICEQFADSITNWSGLEKYRDTMWHKQLHIFLSCRFITSGHNCTVRTIGVWKKPKENQKKDLEGY
jgi:oligoendopeptidase F